MKALVKKYPKTGIWMEDVAMPTMGHNDVLIKVEKTAICGTDLHIIKGETPASSKVILGHEFSGTVYKKGKNAINLKQGDKVAVNPNNFATAYGYIIYVGYPKSVNIAATSSCIKKYILTEYNIRTVNNPVLM